MIFANSANIQSKYQQIKSLRGLPLLVCIVAIGYLAEYLLLAIFRSTYPFELEWIEGVSIDEIRWILSGKLLYGEPTISFIPQSYNPLYFYVSAALTKIIGVGFFAPRLISILASVGCFWLLYKIVVAETGHPLPGIVAMGFYAASFRFSGAWMDIAKTDSLFLFLILAAFYISQKYSSRRAAIASGVIYVLAYYTKQLALPIILVMCVLSLAESKGKTWLIWLTVAVVGLSSFVGMNAISKGWFSFYTVDTIAHHGRSANIWFFWSGLLKQFWPTLLIGLLFLFFILRNPAERQHHRNLWNNLSLVIAMLLASWSVFLKVWTYDNGFMPACIGLAILVGMAYGYFLEHNHKSLLVTGVSTLILLQFAGMFYNPLVQIPSQKDRQATEQLINRLRNLPGEVLVLNHGYVNYLAGKTSFFSNAPYGDVVGTTRPVSSNSDRQRVEKVRNLVEGSFRKQIFDWIVVDKLSDGRMPYYLPIENLFNDPNVFYPVTGARTRPEILMVRNPVARGGDFPLNDPLFEPLLVKGWGAPQSWGRWAIGDRVELNVALEETHPYTIDVEAFSFCIEQHPTVQAMKVLWNDEKLGDAVFGSCDHQTWIYHLPQDSLRKGNNSLAIEFELAPGNNTQETERHNLLNVGFTKLAFTQN